MEEPQPNALLVYGVWHIQCSLVSAGSKVPNEIDICYETLEHFRVGFAIPPSIDFSMWQFCERTIVLTKRSLAQPQRKLTLCELDHPQILQAQRMAAMAG